MKDVTGGTIYQHFRAEERPFIDSILDWIYKVEDYYTPHLTNFMNPRQQHILRSIVGNRETIRLDFYGGYDDAERKRALISPFYSESSEDDFELQLFEVEYPRDFLKISHGQILGSSLSLGIDREKFGDIITDGQRWQFFVDKKLKEFIQLELTKIGRHSVLAKAVDQGQPLEVKEKYEEKTVSISSFRVDAVISSAFNFSRTKAKEFIQADKVKLNWNPISQPSIEVSLYDVLSVRGFGRVMIDEKVGQSRKNKEIVDLKILNRNQ